MSTARCEVTASCRAVLGGTRVFEELSRWSRAPLANGGVVLTAPRGAEAGSISIHRHLRPLRSLRSIVAGLCTDAKRIGPIKRVVTAEGEHAASLDLRVDDSSAHTSLAHVDERSLHRVVALIAGDGDYTLIDGTARGPEIGPLVEDLLYVLPLGLAPDRVRMFPYRAPRGFLGARRCLATCWIAAPGASLVVCDAVSLGSRARTTQQLLWRLDVPESATVDTIDQGALNGSIACWRDHGSERASVELCDQRFQYSLQACGSAAVKALRDVTASIEPITAPVSASAQDLSRWTWM